MEISLLQMIVFEALQVLGRNSVLVLASVTGGQRDGRGARGQDQSRIRVEQ
jgi:hypothetical protein